MGNKEVRDILLGRIVRLDERFWTVAPPDSRFHFNGLRDGAGDVRLFGVTYLKRRYQRTGIDPDAVLTAEETLYSMGRPMQLASMSACKGCLYAPNWIAPVLLTIEEDACGLELTAYTGRSLLTGRIRCRIALWILEHRLSQSITDVGTDKQETPAREEKEPEREMPARTEEEPKRETPVGTETEPRQETPSRIEKAPKREAPFRREGKRVALSQKKKAAPKRLMK